MKKINKYQLLLSILFLSSCDENIIETQELNFHELYCSEESIELWDNNYYIETTTELILDSLEGNIPLKIGCLDKLTKINLSYNNLTGEIPAEIGYLHNLVELDIRGNQLTGEIPAEIGNLNNLSILILSYNNLTGEIPAEIGNLYNLTELRLSNNQLIGAIPPEIINLENLNILDLKVNYFSSIPNNICDLDLNFNNWSDNTIMANQICPPYPECISQFDISTQDTLNCQ